MIGTLEKKKMKQDFSRVESCWASEFGCVGVFLFVVALLNHAVFVCGDACQGFGFLMMHGSKGLIHA